MIGLKKKGDVLVTYMIWKQDRGKLMKEWNDKFPKD
jgi:hypothetical protein